MINAAEKGKMIDEILDDEGVEALIAYVMKELSESSYVDDKERKAAKRMFKFFRVPGVKYE